MSCEVRSLSAWSHLDGVIDTCEMDNMMKNNYCLQALVNWQGDSETEIDLVQIQGVTILKYQDLFLDF